MVIHNRIDNNWKIMQNGFKMIHFSIPIPDFELFLYEQIFLSNYPRLMS